MKIIFFDGYCTICNGFVDWGLKHDLKQQICFASLQGQSAEKYIKDLNLINNPQTVIYFRQGQFYFESDAILYFLKDLKSVWSLLFYFIFIPTFLRNSLYKLVARNRYRFFKKNETCRMPLPHEKNRLLD